MGKIILILIIVCMCTTVQAQDTLEIIVQDYINRLNEWFENASPSKRHKILDILTPEDYDVCIIKDDIVELYTSMDNIEANDYLSIFEEQFRNSEYDVYEEVEIVSMKNISKNSVSKVNVILNYYGNIELTTICDFYISMGKIVRIESNNSILFDVSEVTFIMKIVEGGTFKMSEHNNDGTDESDEKEHFVTVRSFYIGETEVTQGLWKAVMDTDTTPSVYSFGNDYPVENVSWDTIQVFIEKLNAKTNQKFRLPTEEEWEYAARGGKKSRNYKYSGSNELKKVAWYGYRDTLDSNRTVRSPMTFPVRKKAHNELGLYDMSGNVYEWCNDLYTEDYQIVITDTVCDGFRVIRGGSWIHNAKHCRSINRLQVPQQYNFKYIGFRLALSAD